MRRTEQGQGWTISTASFPRRRGCQIEQRRREVLPGDLPGCKSRGKPGRHVDVKLAVHAGRKVSGKEDIARPHGAHGPPDRFGGKVPSLARSGPHARSPRAPRDDGLVDAESLQEPGQALAEVIEHEGQFPLVGLDDVGGAQRPLETGRYGGDDTPVLGFAEIPWTSRLTSLFDSAISVTASGSMSSG